MAGRSSAIVSSLNGHKWFILPILKCRTIKLSFQAFKCIERVLVLGASLGGIKIHHSIFYVRFMDKLTSPILSFEIISGASHFLALSLPLTLIGNSSCWKLTLQVQIQKKYPRCAFFVSSLLLTVAVVLKCSDPRHARVRYDGGEEAQILTRNVIPVGGAVARPYLYVSGGLIVFK